MDTAPAAPVRRRLTLGTFLAAASAVVSAQLPGVPPQQASTAEFRLDERTIADIHAAFDTGALTCQQLVKLYLIASPATRTASLRLNAITTINPDALAAAAALDAQYRRRGRIGPLHCIPVLLKDNIDRSTCRRAMAR